MRYELEFPRLLFRLGHALHAAVMLYMLSFALGLSYGLERGKSEAYSSFIAQIERIIRERDSNGR
jgi:hypothetical protein